MSEPSPGHVATNRGYWNDAALEFAGPGEQAWAGEPRWGIWGVPETDLSLLPPDMSGMDTIELGCGTGYVSAWMARRGATPVGIDLAENQLETARRLGAEHGLAIALVHGDAESTPFPDQSFDFAISEYGAALWCDPYVWIPEAFRLLRPGGSLVFLTNSILAMVCSPLDGSLPITERLERGYFDIHRLDWTNADDDPGGIEFNLPVSAWFDLFTSTGFEVTGFAEPRPSTGGEEVNYYVTADWARRWPSEQVWKLKKP